jgi:hypothetical protein
MTSKFNVRRPGSQAVLTEPVASAPARPPGFSRPAPPRRATGLRVRRAAEARGATHDFGWTMPAAPAPGPSIPPNIRQISG